MLLAGIGPLSLIEKCEGAAKHKKRAKKAAREEAFSEILPYDIREEAGKEMPVRREVLVARMGNRGKAEAWAGLIVLSR